MITDLNIDEFKNAGYKEKIECVCPHCQIKFMRRKKQIYFNFKYRNQTVVYCSIHCFNCRKETRKENILVNCANCGKDTSLKLDKRKKFKNSFCCHRCAAIYHNSHCKPFKHGPQKAWPRCTAKVLGQRKEFFEVMDLNSIKRKLGIPTSTKLACRKPRYPLTQVCKICSNSFFDTRRKTCSLECLTLSLSKAGKTSAKTQSEFRRSKNESMFFDLCQEKFQNVLSNASIFNGWDADVILQDEKIAILWNGKWHYSKITKKHSVAQVQNRDKIKRKEIVSAGFIPYVIKDMGKFKPKFVKDEFQKFLSFVIDITYSDYSI